MNYKKSFVLLCLIVVVVFGSSLVFAACPPVNSDFSSASPSGVSNFAFFGAQPRDYFRVPWTSSLWDFIVDDSTSGYDMQAIMGYDGSPDTINPLIFRRSGVRNLATGSVDARCDYTGRGGFWVYGKPDGIALTMGSTISVHNSYGDVRLFYINLYGDPNPMKNFLTINSDSADLRSSVFSNPSYSSIDVGPITSPQSINRNVYHSYGVYYLASAFAVDSLGSPWTITNDFIFSPGVYGDVVISRDPLSIYDIRGSSQIVSMLEKDATMCGLVGEHISRETSAPQSGVVKCCGARGTDYATFNSHYVCLGDGAFYDWVDICDHPRTTYSTSLYDSYCSCTDNTAAGGFCDGLLDVGCDTSDSVFCGDASFDADANLCVAAGCTYSPAHSCDCQPEYASLDCLNYGEEYVHIYGSALYNSGCYDMSYSSTFPYASWGCRDFFCVDIGYEPVLTIDFNDGSCGGVSSCKSFWSDAQCLEYGCRLVDNLGITYSSLTSASCSRYSNNKDSCSATDDCAWNCKVSDGQPCDTSESCLDGSVCSTDFKLEINPETGDYFKYCHSDGDSVLIGNYYYGVCSGLSDPACVAPTSGAVPVAAEASVNDFVCVDGVLKKAMRNTEDFDLGSCTYTNGFVCAGSVDARTCYGTASCGELYNDGPDADCIADSHCTLESDCYGTDCDGGAGGGELPFFDAADGEPKGIPLVTGFLTAPDSCPAGCTPYAYCSGTVISDCSDYNYPCPTGCSTTPPTYFTTCSGLTYGGCNEAYGCEKSCYVSRWVGDSVDVVALPEELPLSPKFLYPIEICEDGSFPPCSVGSITVYDSEFDPDEYESACVCSGSTWGTCFLDSDGDSYPVSTTVAVCFDVSSATPVSYNNNLYALMFDDDNNVSTPDVQYICGSGTPELDCDDGDESVNPSALDLCNGDTMDDCSAVTPDGYDDPTAPLASNQAGVCANSVQFCGVGGWEEPNYTIITGYEASEISCDNLNNDCDAFTDEGCDDDGDGYADVGMTCNSGDSFLSGLSISPYGFNHPCDFYDGDCVDSDITIHPWAIELCNGVDDDCNAATVDGFNDPSAPVASNQLGVCAGSRQTCDFPNTPLWVEPDYSAISNYQSPEIRCNNLDDDCDGVVDEQSGDLNNDGLCYGDPGCSGVFDCSLFSDSSACPSGCFESPGVCGISGLLCDGARPCLDGSVCSGGACSDSFASCRGLPSNECGSITGCNWASDCNYAVARTETIFTLTYTCDDASGATSFGCDWVCPPPSPAVPVIGEVCGNGFDDDGDGFVDCQDTDCNAGGSLSIIDADLDSFICLGSNITGDINLSALGLSYYCGNAFDSRIGVLRDDVGLCCPIGQKPEYDSDFNIWFCNPTSPCYPEPAYECGFTYSEPNFTSWFGDVGCLDVSAPSACCSVIQFGELDYYSDEGNVVIY